MRELSIDIETFSSKDLTKCGVYAYTDSNDFEILLFAYAFDNEKVKIVDLKMGEKIPKEIIEALESENIIKTAFNANFERVCLEKYLGIYMEPRFWRCTSVYSLELGLPPGLGNVGKVLKLENGKMKEGMALIRYFSMPCKETKSNGLRKRNLPSHDIGKWNLFKEYCIRDVEVERDIKKKLQEFKVTKKEWKLWELDQRINDRGILVNSEIIENAIEGEKLFKKKLLEKAKSITGLDNPNSVAQLKEWFKSKGLMIESLSKEKLKELLECDLNGEIKEVLTLRKELSKTSVKKYEAMERSMGKDKRVRGLLQFYGANRTGRWAGKLVQVQNLPQNKAKDIDLCRELLIDRRYEIIDIMYGSLSSMLSELIRTAFIPKKGDRFIVSDFSAIEARVIAWLSDEKWRIDVFNSHGKIYEASASKMFKVPIEEVDKELRAKGKISELALGYQGSVGALVSMGALKMGLDEQELIEIVKAWRRENKNITRLWVEVERKAKESIKERKQVSLFKGLEFSYEKGILFIKLPSGRRLAYQKARVELDNTLNKEIITYGGIDGATKAWGRLKTYGGKLTENIVQAIARDLLGEAMLRLDKRGYEIVMHIHDEVVIEVKEEEVSIEEINKIMGKEIEWAKGLNLKAESFVTKYYKKD